MTGERPTLPPDLPELAGRVKKLTGHPVAVGFGISQPAQARQISSFADGGQLSAAPLVRKLAANAGSSPVPPLAKRARLFAQPSRSHGRRCPGKQGKWFGGTLPMVSGRVKKILEKEGNIAFVSNDLYILTTRRRKQ